MKYIPINLINLISIFLPKNLKMKLMVYLIDIEYLNNYKFLKKTFIRLFLEIYKLIKILF